MAEMVHVAQLMNDDQEYDQAERSPGHPGQPEFQAHDNYNI